MRSLAPCAPCPERQVVCAPQGSKLIRTATEVVPTGVPNRTYSAANHLPCFGDRMPKLSGLAVCLSPGIVSIHPSAPPWIALFARLPRLLRMIAWITILVIAGPLTHSQQPGDLTQK